ncbi:MAG TPA: hypothetical protein VK459_26385, partial [Polyangiaceae bacterium]|nr:hypothetical protein [Polyangiaceae bacterium]
PGFPEESSGGSPSGSGGSGGSGSGSGGSGTGGSGGGSPGSTCGAVPACDAALPDPGPMLPWNNGEPDSFANHRGRDLFLNPGDPQWILGKFAYGKDDNDLEDEQVDIWLLRDCGSKWELLGTALTSNDDFFGSGPNDTVEGVKDDGGRVYFRIPAEKELGIGRHRVRMVVRGDLSGTDVYIEVVPKGTPLFVTDIDGTLTESEYIEFQALLEGELPPVHPDAAKAFSILVSKGYRPMYLTARPEWLGQRTRDVLAANKFPPGIVHTTVTDTGAVGGSAAEYKTGELAMLKARALVPSLGFGNAESDAQAYENGGIEPVTDRVFYQFDDVAFGGRRIESYTQLLEEFEGRADAVCPP